MLENILEHIKELTGYNVYFSQSKNPKENCIVYKDYVIFTDGKREQHRLELSIISDSYQDCLTKSSAINDYLVTPYDLHNETLECQINGGGLLEDKDNHKVHYVTYYYYTIRR